MPETSSCVRTCDGSCAIETQSCPVDATYAKELCSLNGSHHCQIDNGKHFVSGGISPIWPGQTEKNQSRLLTLARIRNDRSAFLANELSRFFIIGCIFVSQHAAVRTRSRSLPLHVRSSFISIHDWVHDLPSIPDAATLCCY